MLTKLFQLRFALFPFGAFGTPKPTASDTLSSQAKSPSSFNRTISCQGDASSCTAENGPWPVYD